MVYNMLGATGELSNYQNGYHGERSVYSFDNMYFVLDRIPADQKGLPLTHFGMRSSWNLKAVETQPITNGGVPLKGCFETNIGETQMVSAFLSNGDYSVTSQRYNQYLDDKLPDDSVPGHYDLARYSSETSANNCLLSSFIVNDKSVPSSILSCKYSSKGTNVHIWELEMYDKSIVSIVYNPVAGNNVTYKGFDSDAKFWIVKDNSNNGGKKEVRVFDGTSLNGNAISNGQRDDVQ